MDAKIKSLWEKLMVRYDVPKLVFSIIGDSETFVPKVWPRPIFQNALIEAAKHSGGDTWILLRGKEKCVSSLVLAAIDDYTYLQNQHLSDNDKTNANDLPVKAIRLNFRDDVKEKNLNRTGTPMKRCASPFKVDGQDNLESTKLRELKDHIECTIVDSAVDFNDVRLQFESFIQEQKVSFLKEKEQRQSKKTKQLKLVLPIPVVRILVEGDINSIEQIVESVKRNIPVIIVKGSGKVTNLILDYMESPKSLKRNASLLFGIGFRSERFRRLREGLKELKNSDHLINVFDVEKNNTGHFLQVTGEAIVRARANFYFQNENMENISEHKGETCTIISGEMKKKHDRRKIVQDEKDMQFDVTPASMPLFFYLGYQVLLEKRKLMDCGNILLFEALKANRCDYVKVLVSEGVMFKETHLAKLYKETFPAYEEIWQFFKKQELVRIRIHSDSVLSFTNEPLVEEQTQYEKMEKKEKKRQKMEQYKAVSKAVRKLCCYLLHHDDPEETAIELQTGENKPSSGQIHMDLLLWAIFAQREEIAGYFWLKGENHLVSSLICTMLLRKLSKMSADKKECNLSKNFENHASLFEKRASLLLDEMYKQNEKQAMATMDQKVTVFGIKTTPLSFAYENLMYDVLGHPCSQHWMDLIWHKELLFLAALIVHSDFVLTKVSDRDPRNTTARAMEYSFYVWGFGDFIEEYRPLMIILILIPRRKFRRFLFKLKLHVNDFWNLVDLVWFITLAIALIVREVESVSFLINSRQLFSLSLLLMYLRFLLAFMMIRTFGPTLIMIKEMLKDLLAFLWLTMFVLLGVGMFYHANLWPDYVDLFPDGWNFFTWRIWIIISLPFWKLFGETNRDFLRDPVSSTDPFDNTKCTNPYLGGCPRFDWMVPLISAFYMLFSNVLLINLVIAMFSYTFGRVKANSEKLWMFERYVIIKEYQHRKPSMINIVCFLRYFICLLFRKSINRVAVDSGKTKKCIEDKKKERMNSLMKFQKIMATRVVYSQYQRNLGKNGI